MKFDPLSYLEDLLERRALSALFQPILCLEEGRVLGHEALIRGPSDGPLHAPMALFREAARFDRLVELDRACLVRIFEARADLRLEGRLFANITPASLLDPSFSATALLEFLARHGVDRRHLVLEVTESTPGIDYGDLRQACQNLRDVGVEIAMDDLGEGFSSLRLWSELNPAYVKLDKHFISGIHQDPDKLRFVRSIQQIAEETPTRVIAEGVENVSELAVIKDLGIPYAQGYLIGRPANPPARGLPREVEQTLGSGRVSVPPGQRASHAGQVRALKLLIPAPAVELGTPSETVLEILLSRPDLHAIAVTRQAVPVGIIHRHTLFNLFSRLYSRELYGRRPCDHLMDPAPLVVDRHTEVQELSELVVRKGRQAFTDGFIITEAGHYLGMGSGFDLMREITELQLVAARYANPLTLLPGNVPIQEHMERLLAQPREFTVAYCDLDQFKPYNDIYGFRKGDEIIRLLARLLMDEVDGQLDFTGHVGGDDFVVLFQSPDWETRCRRVLARFEQERLAHFNPEHVRAGGYLSEDRRGHLEFHPLVSLSIGAALIDPALYRQHQEIARAATEAKKMAKRSGGNTLFVDPRRRPSSLRLADGTPGAGEQDASDSSGRALDAA